MRGRASTPGRGRVKVRGPGPGIISERRRRLHGAKPRTRAGSNLARVLTADYAKAVRERADFDEVTALLREFRGIFKGFNRQPVAYMPIKAYAEIGQKLDFSLNAATYRNGPALRGFYAGRQTGLKRPLIYINTAHHPVVVGSSFIHELSHHLSATVLGASTRHAHFLFDADYPRQLTVSGELLADLMVSVAGYPRGLARQIFAADWGHLEIRDAADLQGPALAEVKRHLARAYAFRLAFDHENTEQYFEYLVGIIHYARLRQALLSEYDL